MLLKRIVIISVALCCLCTPSEIFAGGPFTNADYTDYFFETFEEARSAIIECITAPGHDANITCDTHEYVPYFVGDGGCFTGFRGNLGELIIGMVNCYYYPMIEPEEDCCKQEEGMCCPPGVPKCPSPLVGNPISVLSGGKEENETDLQVNTAFEKNYKFYRTYKSRSNIASM
ncbi:MAG: hypothetical protein HZB87_12180, partial [Desulfatitalea sp.]|nr:hypothetical protein [Desulfatitalea sp.]